MYVFRYAYIAITQLVEALRCKSEGRGLDSQCVLCDFSLTSYRPHYGLVVDSASERNEYKGYLLLRKADNLATFMCRFCGNSGSLNLLEP